MIDYTDIDSQPSCSACSYTQLCQTYNEYYKCDLGTYMREESEVFVS